MMVVLRCVFALAMLAGAANAHEPGQWQGGVEGPQPRSEMAVVQDGALAYLIGDYNGATEVLIYDLDAQSWRVGPDFPYPVHHPMAAALDGSVFVFGGYVNGWEASDAVWVLDGETLEWSEAAPMPSPLAAGGATTIDGKIHVVGGSLSGAVNTDAHMIYDPQADAWETASPMPTQRDHLGVVAIEGEILAIGGRVDGDPVFCALLNGDRQHGVQPGHRRDL